MTLSLVSSNPHAHCDSGSPCPTCAPKYAPAEQAARERHLAGADVPPPLEYRIEWADNLVVLTRDGRDVYTLDESDLIELQAKLLNPEPCSRINCWAPAESRGFCAAHDEMEKP